MKVAAPPIVTGRPGAAVVAAAPRARDGGPVHPARVLAARPSRAAPGRQRRAGRRARAGRPSTSATPSPSRTPATGRSPRRAPTTPRPSSSSTVARSTGGPATTSSRRSSSSDGIAGARRPGLGADRRRCRPHRPAGGGAARRAPSRSTGVLVPARTATRSATRSRSAPPSIRAVNLPALVGRRRGRGADRVRAAHRAGHRRRRRSRSRRRSRPRTRDPTCRTRSSGSRSRRSPSSVASWSCCDGDGVRRATSPPTSPRRRRTAERPPPPAAPRSWSRRRPRPGTRTRSSPATTSWCSARTA